MAIAGPAMQDFERIQRETGSVRAAVDDRDGPFREHRTYWEAYQAGKK
jgi:enoyl-CoA hydratase